MTDRERAILNRLLEQHEMGTRRRRLIEMLFPAHPETTELSSQDQTTAKKEPK